MVFDPLTYNWDRQAIEGFLGEVEFIGHCRDPRINPLIGRGYHGAT